MLLSYNRLKSLVDAGIITNVLPEAVQSSSIDIRFGEMIELEQCCTQDNPATPLLHRVVLKNKDRLKTRKHSLIRDGSVIIYPGECFLAHSEEVFNLPNNIAAEFMLKSSAGRIFLQHMKAGWCDPTWNGSVLTMEFKNETRSHEIEINYLDWAGQMVFFQCDPVPTKGSYALRGRYNGDKGISGVKLDPARSIIFGEEAEDREADEYADKHPVQVEFEVVYPNKARLIVDEKGEVVNE